MSATLSHERVIESDGPPPFEAEMMGFLLENEEGGGPTLHADLHGLNGNKSALSDSTICLLRLLLRTLWSFHQLDRVLVLMDSCPSTGTGSCAIVEGVLSSVLPCSLLTNELSVITQVHVSLQIACNLFRH